MGLEMASLASPVTVRAARVRACWCMDVVFVLNDISMLIGGCSPYTH